MFEWMSSRKSSALKLGGPTQKTHIPSTWTIFLSISEIKRERKNVSKRERKNVSKRERERRKRGK